MFVCGDLIEATSSKIVRDKLSVLNNEYKTVVKNNDYDYYETAFPAENIRTRILSRVGKTWDYNLLVYICEHFAKWCRNGKYKSHQGPYDDAKCVGAIKIWHDEEYARKVEEEGRDDDRVGGIFEHDAKLATYGKNGPLKVDLIHFSAGGMKDGYGMSNGIKVVGVDVIGFSGQAGFAMDTGVVCKNGSVGGKFLGTGFSIGKKTEVSFLGTSVGIDFKKVEEKASKLCSKISMMGMRF